ncbi:MAG TPA: hypothetical protein VFI95_14460 [Terriglobales bacterium]|nr:hypothetical protein [Terriglobales bacterium]
MRKVCLPLFLSAVLAGCGGGAQNSSLSTSPLVPAKTQLQVMVTSPANNSTVGTPVNFVATATTTCARGIASMTLLTAPGQVGYKVNGAKLNANLSLNPGSYSTQVQSSDNCGGTAASNVQITVQPATPPATAVSAGANTLSSLQKSSGWKGYALEPTSYSICSSCQPGGPQTTWSSQQGITSPSLSGSAMRFDIGGQTQYSDVLWNNHLIGDFSTQGIFDSNHTIASATHNFVYDVYFFSTNLPASQALEFDINQFVNGQSFIWGHECRIAGGNEWDIWDNQGQKWHPTGVSCKPVNNAWNHLTIAAQRTSDGHLLFQTITLNGQTATLNYYESPTSTSWQGITINYQMDGNGTQQPYTVYLDNLNFSYW